MPDRLTNVEPHFDPSSFSNEPYVQRIEKPWGWELHWTPEDLPYVGKLLHIKGADVLAIVKELRQERPQLRRFLICNRKGGKYTLDGFQSQWRRALERAVKAGLKQTFRFHDLRAKSASDAKSDQEAADRLGHGDVELTREVYRRLPREAEALSILDRLPKSAKEAE